jgi:hypothetical protein
VLSEEAGVTYFGNVLCSSLLRFVLFHSSFFFSSLSYFLYPYGHLTFRSALQLPFLFYGLTQLLIISVGALLLFCTARICEQALQKTQFYYKEKSLRCEYLHYSKWNFLQPKFQLPGRISRSDAAHSSTTRGSGTDVYTVKRDSARRPRCSSLRYQYH